MALGEVLRQGSTRHQKSSWQSPQPALSVQIRHRGNTVRGHPGSRLARRRSVEPGGRSNSRGPLPTRCQLSRRHEQREVPKRCMADLPASRATRTRRPRRMSCEVTLTRSVVNKRIDITTSPAATALASTRPLRRPAGRLGLDASERNTCSFAGAVRRSTSRNARRSPVSRSSIEAKPPDWMIRAVSQVHGGAETSPCPEAIPFAMR